MAQGIPASWPARVRALTRGELTPVPPRRPPPCCCCGTPTAAARPCTAAQTRLHGLRRRRYAYPGGGVDPRDERPVRLGGPAAARRGPRCSASTGRAAQAVVCAAVRETFEESGVLLAGPDDGTVVADTTGDGLGGRPGGAGRPRAVLRRTSWPAAAWSCAPTCWRRGPAGSPRSSRPRRYDTWFFVAALPAGQRTRDVSGEADRTVWLRPADGAGGLRRAASWCMLPPTIATLRDLMPYATGGRRAGGRGRTAT